MASGWAARANATRRSRGDRLGDHVASAADFLEQAKASIDEASSMARRWGGLATGVRGLTHRVEDAVEDSFRRHPYGAIAIAVGVGFMLAFLSRDRTQ